MLSILLIQKDKDLISDLDYDEIDFPVQEKHFSKIEVKSVFGYKNELLFSIYVSDQKFEDSMDFIKSNYVYIKGFNRFVFHKTKNKSTKWFCRSCLQCFSSENILTKHKEDCLIINGKQLVKLEVELENYFKQIPVPFKIYADFECTLEGVESYEGSYTKKYQDHVPCSFAYKVFCIDDRFSKPTVVSRGENAASEFIKTILKEDKYCKKVIKKQFNKNLIMSEKNNIYINKVAVVGFVKNLLIMMKKKLEIIVT